MNEALLSELKENQANKDKSKTLLASKPWMLEWKEKEIWLFTMRLTVGVLLGTKVTEMTNQQTSGLY